jgi:hypothetical protein
MADDKPLPPLITARSPSYERARRELANPSPAGDAAVVALLSRLVEAEYDAERASLGAATREPDLAELRDAAADHAARRHALEGLVRSLGGSPPRLDESRELLTHGADAVARAPDVMATLRAMRDELAAVYSEATRDPHLNDQQRAAVKALAPH